MCRTKTSFKSFDNAIFINPYFFEYSANVLIIYWIFGSFVLLTFYIVEKFPNEVGPKYFDFLKRHPSPGVFEKHCGNPWSTLKETVKDLKFIKVAAQHGATMKKC